MNRPSDEDKKLSILYAFKQWLPSPLVTTTSIICWLFDITTKTSISMTTLTLQIIFLPFGIG